MVLPQLTALKMPMLHHCHYSDKYAEKTRVLYTFLPHIHFPTKLLFASVYYD